TGLDFPLDVQDDNRTKRLSFIERQRGKQSDAYRGHGTISHVPCALVYRRLGIFYGARLYAEAVHSCDASIVAPPRFGDQYDVGNGSSQPNEERHAAGTNIFLDNIWSLQSILRTLYHKQ